MTDTTHAQGCWGWGPRHYECAVGQIERLQAEVEKLRAEALEESARVCDALSKSGDWARALRLADECEESAQVWANEIDTRQRAAAELRRLHAEVERLRTDGASAVRWAPGSAYWSDVLRELFGPHARKGIDVVEARWRAELERANTAEALLRQAMEALEVSTRFVYADMRPQCEDAIAALRERIAETANDLTRCPNCGGPADNGHDREVPPNPYWCSKCMES